MSIRPVVVLQKPNYSRFLKMANDGNVYFSLTLAMQGNKARDHGFLWRVPQSELPGFIRIRDWLS